ncbi:mannose-6-phosphate isomerase [Porifericola rhodea]|uniref:type I phosphomannose isomerase catalytic subunit n=1 Tax=Porifericola rhodea TaxID=930972 RepID=UPI002665C258|nr:type I phosphomannose isomerase catalytic subunit [Porifericola rhodea]WKN33407.1 mannose-6-phosphate isomerase [Porifericola rhodea]
MTALYPLKFRTIFKDKLWGGKKIKTILNKDFGPLPNCGETWEISGVEGNISEVAEGALAGKDLKSLIQEYQGELVGNKVYNKFQDEFPLLVKFIDANDDLSIQVHPDDKLAKERHNSFGKTEMWYIFQADEGSKLISGFNQPMSKEKYLEAFNAGKLTDILNQEPVQADDVFFLPAGRVHTIGKGLLLAEIQQTSDITYRIYDFDRTDAEGNARELHVEEALDAIDYQHYDSYKTDYEPQLNKPVKLVSCPYFETFRIEANQAIERNYQELDSFVIYVCMEGEAEIMADGKGYSMKKGDSYLIPASIKHTKLTTSSSFKMLESFVPQEK